MVVQLVYKGPSKWKVGGRNRTKTEHYGSL